MRTRLRDAYSNTELAEVYAKPHNHMTCVDHKIRVAMTILLAQTVVQDSVSGADLSCGDGTILRNLRLYDKHFGDFAPGYRYTGPIEQTIEQIPNVDIFVCTETIEHLDDPDTVLAKIRTKTRRLVLSTPVDNFNDTNHEHYWAWSREEVERMLTLSGFKVVVYTALDMRPSNGDYQFGIWSAQ